MSQTKECRGICIDALCLSLSDYPIWRPSMMNMCRKRDAFRRFTCTCSVRCVICRLLVLHTTDWCICPSLLIVLTVIRTENKWIVTSIEFRRSRWTERELADNCFCSVISLCKSLPAISLRSSRSIWLSWVFLLSSLASVCRCSHNTRNNNNREDGNSNPRRKKPYTFPLSSSPNVNTSASDID